MTKVLLCGSGSSLSTYDVEMGYYHALKAAGIDVGLYALDKRIFWARGYLDYQWRKLGKPAKRPTSNDIAYTACEEIAQRAAYYQPDWVMFVAGRLIHPHAVIALRHVGFKTALIATENPYDDPFYAEIAPLFDVMFVNERTSVEGLRAANRNTFYLPHAYDPAKHRPEAAGAGPAGDAAAGAAITQVDESEIPAHDVVFVGTDFEERCKTLAAVDWDGIDVGLYGQWTHGRRFKRIRPLIRGGIQPNEVTAALYRKARIGLNLYRRGQGWARGAQPVERADSLNPRAVELAACGVFTISDYRAEVAEVFGDAVPTFKSPAELGDLVRYYLAHPEEREAKAARLPGLVSGRTFANGARWILEVLSDV
jgi:hypothetical protein